MKFVSATIGCLISTSAVSYMTAVSVSTKRHIQDALVEVSQTSAKQNVNVHKSHLELALLAKDDGKKSEKRHPITRVVNILKAMQDDLAAKAEEDEALYKKMKCWADTNRKEKTQQIADGEDTVASLTAAIEEGESTSARLIEETKNLKSDIEEKSQSKEEATKIRQKQAAEFAEEQKDLTESITALKGAIVILKRHHGGKEETKEAASLLQTFLSKSEAPKSNNVLITSNSRKSKLQSLVSVLLKEEPKKEGNTEEDEGYYNAPAIGQSNYNSASGEIFGMLQQMQEDMENDLKEAIATEGQQSTDYSALKSSLEAEIAEATASHESKTTENGKVLEKLGVDKQDKIDTNRDLAANKDYLANLETTWSEFDAQYKERVETRATEVKAVNEAIKILTSDEARDLFSSHFNRKSESFMQLNSTSETRRQLIRKAISYLASHGVKGTNKITAIALVSLDAFEKVQKAIDDMIADLQEQSKSEIKQRDFCIKELNEKEKQILTETAAKNTAESEVQAAEELIASLDGEIAKLNEEIHEIDVAVKVAGEDRSAANKEFQEVVDEQVMTVKILNKALEVLKKVYGKPLPGEEKKEENTSLLSQPVGPAAPKSFETYQPANGGVVGVLEAIIQESVTMKKEAVTAEQTAQVSYEKFIIESNKNRVTKQEAVVNKTKSKGEAEQSLETAKEALSASTDSLLQLADEQNSLKGTCDFLLKNFEVIQEARANDIDALKTVKGILSGAK